MTYTIQEREDWNKSLHMQFLHEIKEGNKRQKKIETVEGKKYRTEQNS